MNGSFSRLALLCGFFKSFNRSTILIVGNSCTSVLDPKKNTVMQDENRSHEKWSQESQPLKFHENQIPKGTIWKSGNISHL